MSEKIKIKEILGTPFLYEISSWSKREEPYQVDLLENNGNGACTCDDFRGRCQPNYNRNGGVIVDYGTRTRKNPERTICKHIKLVRWDQQNNLLRELARIHRPKEGE